MQEDKKGQSSPLSRFEVYGALLEQPPHNSKQPVVKNLTKSCLFKIDLKCLASFQNCFWSSNDHLICAGQLFQPHTPGDDMMRGENHLDCLDFIFYILHLQSTPLRQFEFYTTKIICILCLRGERESDFKGLKHPKVDVPAVLVGGQSFFFWIYPFFGWQYNDDWESQKRKPSRSPTSVLYSKNRWRLTWKRESLSFARVDCDLKSLILSPELQRQRWQR